MKSINELIEGLSRLRDQGDPTSQEDSEAITAWRDRIDAIDRIVLALLNERSRSANAIGHVKQRLNLPIYVPEREQRVLENVLSGNGGPLEDAAVRHLFERIIDETRSLERRKYQAKGNDHNLE
ncbi:MAG: chorismate mutase [Bacteroidetes bacterium]|nr:chorismate mutase [Bacteroidota bacterium]MDA1333366.1 chorismate mutase [Bacteroidota bacterium]